MEMSNHTPMRIRGTRLGKVFVSSTAEGMRSLIGPGRRDALAGNRKALAAQFITGWHRWAPSAEWLMELSRSMGISIDLLVDEVTTWVEEWYHSSHRLLERLKFSKDLLFQ
jgi:hypothetical protein